MTLPVRRTTTNDLRTWDPFADFDDLQNRFSRLVDATFGPGFGQALQPLAQPLAAWTAAVDVEETDESFVIEAELTGVRAEDVTVELRDNRLSVHGEVVEQERTGILSHTTRRTGQFDYRLTLPAQVQSEPVSATLKDGVLRLELRKSEADEPKRITVSAG